MRIRDLYESKIPTKSFKQLYHVGSLDASKKREGSYEGAGLSVSTHPDAWRRIAKGFVTGDTYVLQKSGNKFLSANNLNKSAKNTIQQWAVKNGLLEPSIVYRVSYYDDELDSEVYSDYDSYEQAKLEADDESDIKKIVGSYKPTDKLKTLTKNPRMTPTSVLDYVLPLYAEELGYDGVWWQDTLDIGKFSAPRGVIVPSKISTWNIQKS
jgi:hypothetical protein